MYYDPYGDGSDPCWNADTTLLTGDALAAFNEAFNNAFPGQTYDKDNPVHRWWYFVKAFNLYNADDDDDPATAPPTAPYQNMAMYFTPRCAYGEGHGTTQGDNYGVLAKIPVLVK
jgi:hypothetical protein